MRRIALLLTVMSVALVVSSGVGWAAIKFGTERSEFIEGTKKADILYGKGGHDSLAGRGGNDTLYGNKGSDALHGGSFVFNEIFQGRKMVPDGNDKLFGGVGDDCVWGGTGNDILYGGEGSDFVGTYCLDFIMDTGNDVMYAGPGNDFVMAVEAPFRFTSLQERDLVYCGPGIDDVIYQKGVDVLFDCEKKNQF